MTKKFSFTKKGKPGFTASVSISKSEIDEAGSVREAARRKIAKNHGVTTEDITNVQPVGEE